MAFSYKFGQFTKPTSGTAPVSQSVTGVGFQPKAVILWSSNKVGATLGTVADYYFTVGLSDGTSTSDNRTNGISSRNAATNGETEGYYSNTSLIFQDNGAISSRGTISAFGSDGFTFNWTTLDISIGATVINYIALGGTDITNTKVGSITAKTSTGNQTTTGIGFQPDIVFFLPTDKTTENGTYPDAVGGFGVAVSSTQQGCIGFASQNGASVAKRILRTDKVIQKLSNSGADKGSASLSSFNSDGWVLNWATSSSTADQIGYLAIKGGGPYKVGSFTNAASGTADQTVTGLGVRPEGMMLFGHGTASQSSTTSVNENRYSIGAASSSTNRACSFSSHKNAAAPTVAKAGNNNAGIGTVITPTSTTDTTELVIDLVSFDSDGFTIKPTTNTGVVGAAAWIYLTFGAAAGAALITRSIATQTVSLSDTTTIFAKHFRTPSETVSLTDSVSKPGLKSRSIATQTVSVTGGTVAVQKIAGGAISDFKVKTGVFAKPTSGTPPFTQAITGVGFQPKAVLIYSVLKANDTSFVKYNQTSLGFSAGTTAADNKGVWYGSDDDVTTSFTNTIVHGGKCFITADASGTTTPTLGEAAITTLGADGFTLTWSTCDNTAGDIFYVALGGTNLTNAKVGQFSSNTTAGNQAITGVGFQPDFLMFLSTPSTSTSTTSSTTVATEGSLALGFAKSSTKRGAIAVQSRDAQSTSDTYRYQRTDRCIVRLSATGTILAEADLVSNDSSGFTINWLDPPSSADTIFYLALKGGNFDVGSFNSTTGTGTQIITTGFQPAGVLLASFGDIAGTTVRANNRFSFGSGNSSTSRTCIWHGDKDAQGNTATSKYGSNTLIAEVATENSTAGSSVKELELDLSAIGTTSFTVNKVTNTGVAGAVQFLYVAFGGTTLPGIVARRIDESVSVTENLKRRATKNRALASQSVVLSQVLSAVKTRTSPAGLLVKTGRIARPTSTSGTPPFTQTVTNIGFTPKAIIFYSVNTSALNVWQDAYNFNIGISSGGTTENKAAAYCSSDAEDTSVASRAIDQSASIINCDATGTVTSKATITSFSATSNGSFTLSWSVLNEGAVTADIFYIVLGGQALTNAKVGQFSPPTSNGTQTVSSVGFAPDLVMFINPRITASDTNQKDSGTGPSIGFAKDATKQFYISAISEDARTTSDTNRYFRTDKCTGSLNHSDGTDISYEASFTGTVSNGFTLNYNNTGTTSDYLTFYLALKGGDYDLGVVNLTANNTSQSVTGLTFSANGMIFLGHGAASQTSGSSIDHNRISFGSATSAIERFNATAGDKDNQSVSTAAIRSSDTSIFRAISSESTLATSTQTALIVDLASKNADGFTLGKSQSDGTTAPTLAWVALGSAEEITTVTADSTHLYSGAGRTGRIYSLRYHITAKVNKDLVYKYAIRYAVVTTLTSVYQIHINVRNSIVKKYNIFSSPFRQLVSSYRLNVNEVRLNLTQYYNIGVPANYVKRSTVVSGLTNTGGDGTSERTEFIRELRSSPGTESTVSYTISGSVTERLKWITPVGKPGISDWENGPYQWRFRVSQGNSSLQIIEVILRRLSSDGQTVRASKSSGALTTSLGTIGLKEGTISWADGTQNPGGRQRADRLEVVFRVKNLGSSSRTGALFTNLMFSQDELDIPFAEAAMVGAFLTCSYNRKAFTRHDSPHRYNIRNKTGQRIITFRYNNRILVGSNATPLQRILVYHLRQPATLERIFVYHNAGVISNSNIFRYALRQNAGRNYTFGSDTRNNVTQISAQVYPIRNLISTIIQNYNFFELNFIPENFLTPGQTAEQPRTLTMQYHITGLVVVPPLNMRYDMRAFSFSKQTHRYMIRKSVWYSTEDDNYIQPLRAKVQIRSKGGQTIYYSYDPWIPEYTPNIRVLSCDVSLGLGSSGTAEIVIEDTNEKIDRRIIGNGNRVIIQAGKTQDQLVNLFSGYVKRFRVERSATNQLTYRFTCYGTQIRFTERITNFARAAKRLGFNSNIPRRSDEDMQVYKLVKSIIEETDHLPLGGPRESQINTNQVDPSVKEFIPSINEQLSDWSSVVNYLADTVGANWGVDANDSLFFRYPIQTHSGVTIRSSDFGVTQRGDTTAYFTGPWNFEDSIDKADGFSNRLWGVGGKVETSGSDTSESANSFTSLKAIDIAQRFTANSSKLQNIGLLLSRSTAVIPPASELSGRSVLLGWIVADNGGQPTGKQAAAFNIKLTDIETTPTPIFKLNVLVGGESQIVVGRNYWIILFGFVSTTHPDFEIRWHHDNQRTGTSATRPEGTTGNLFNPAWTVLNGTGPTYTYSLSSSGQIITEASDSLSIDKFGLVESVIDASWIQEEATMDKYLSSILAYASRPKRIYDIKSITAPDILLFPGTYISIHDPKSKTTLEDQIAQNIIDPSQNVIAEITEVSYSFDAGINGLGTHYIDIRPIGYPEIVSKIVHDDENTPTPIPQDCPPGFHRDTATGFCVADVVIPPPSPPGGGGGTGVPEPDARCTSLQISTITASLSTGSTQPIDVLDNQLTTGWQANGKGTFITMHLASVMTICSVDIAWWRGNVRQQDYQIAVSQDNNTFTTVFSGRSSGLTQQLQKTVIPLTLARYVRVIGFGNTENDYTSIAELRVNGFSSTTPPPPPPQRFVIGNSRRFVYNMAGPPTQGCPPGQHRDPVSGQCVPDDVTPPPPTTTDWNMVFAGDWDDTSATRSVISRIKTANPELICNLGDCDYGSGGSSTDSWLSTYGTLKTITKGFSLGNHDDDSSAKTPKLNSAFGVTRNHYSFDFQGIHVLCLNSEGDMSSSSAQATFARSDLQTAASKPYKWRFVIVHKPIYGSPNNHPNETTLRNWLHPLMDTYKIDFCCWGHNHNYERTYPIKYNSSSSNSPIVTNNNTSTYSGLTSGVIMATIGTAGRSFASISGKISYAVYNNDNTHGFVNCTFQNNMTVAKFEFISTSGSVIDSWTITKTEAQQASTQSPDLEPPVLPPAPPQPIDRDEFGIQKIYPTRTTGAAGDEWSMNIESPQLDNRMHNYTQISFRPQDESWNIGNTSILSVHSASSFGYIAGTMDTYSFPNIESRGYWYNVDDWRNIEVTGEFKYNSGETVGTSSGGISILARAENLVNNINQGCGGSAYVGRLRFDGATVFGKQLQYPIVEEQDSVSHRFGSLADGRWFRLKFVIYNDLNGNVKAELWLDSLADNNWEKVNEILDIGEWGTTGNVCGGVPDQKITWGGPIVQFKWTDTNISFRNLSIREIEVPGTVG